MNQTTPLGRTGRSVSAISYGAMHLSIQGRPSEEEAKRTLDALLDRGINFIDTADVYCLNDDDLGHNERLIASTLARRHDRGRDVMVATKGGLRRPRGAWTVDARPQRLREACEASLRALGVDQIFLYYLHAPDPEVIFEKSVEALAKLQHAGKLRHIGLSNVSQAQIESAETIVEVTAIQNRLNLFSRSSLEEGITNYCAERGITFVAYSPLGGKRLSKKLETLPLLRDLASRHLTSPPAIALGWLRALGGTIVPIPGPTRVETVSDTFAAIDLVLAPDEVATITSTKFPRDPE
jgi:aryl-alcohol dehydrogenase-like predicted oxidoreductase